MILRPLLQIAGPRPHTRWLIAAIAFFRDIFRQFVADNCRLMAGALAFYTLFALPMVLLISVSIAGVIFGPEYAENQLTTQAKDIVGEAGAEQLNIIVDEAKHSERSRFPIIGVLIMLFGAVRAFEQLQVALNRVWGVELDPELGGFRNMFRKRSLSFAMVCSLATILAATLVLSAALSYFGQAATSNWPIQLSGAVFYMADMAISTLVIAVLFGLVYKILPDAQVQWRDVWLGALFAAAVFVIGKTAIGYYLGKSAFGSAYGAAGSLAILLVWIYFSALLLLFGAEFTKVWARRYGTTIIPNADACEVVVERLPSAAATAKSEC